MNIDVLAVRSARTDTTERAHAGATVGLIVCVAAALAAAMALVVAGRDATVGLVVVSCLAIVWALAGVIITIRHHCPAGSIVHTFAAATAVGALAWSVNSTKDLEGAAALAADAGQRFALAVTPALVFHLLMTLPDGRLARPGHRAFVLAGYVIAAVTGVALLADRDSIIVWPVALLWAATFLAAPIAHANYLAAGAVDRRRMQWVGWAALVATEIAIVSVALSLVSDWPHHDAEIALGSHGSHTDCPSDRDRPAHARPRRSAADSHGRTRRTDGADRDRIPAGACGVRAQTDG